MLSMRNGSPVTGRKASGCVSGQCLGCCEALADSRYPLAKMEPTPDPAPFTLPSPPADPDVVEVSRLDATAGAEAGQLTAGWSTVFAVGWLLIAGSFAAVWYSSRLIGLSTWWLGPTTDPQLILISLLPFTVPLALATAGWTAQRWLPWWGIGGAVFVAVVAVFDVSRVPGYAAIEFGLALAGLFISVACFAGVFRSPESTRPLERRCT